MKKYLKIIPLLFMAAFLLNGCFVKSGDELLQLPKPSENYLALQNQLDKILNGGAAYAAPEAGEYRSTVQLQDIDHDGEDEAIVFFRESKDNGKFYVYLYKKQGSQYSLAGKLTGTGTAVYSVDYPVISQDGTRAVVVSWTLGNNLSRGMTVGILRDRKFTSILDTEYTDYTFSDLNQDGDSELLTFVSDDKGQPVARLFQKKDDKMEKSSELSLHMDSTILKLTQGLTADRHPAIYVEEKGESGTGLFTDILVMQDNTLTDLNTNSVNTEVNTVEDESSTYRSLMVYTRDINGDGIVEVPQVMTLTPPVSQSEEISDTMCMLGWYQYSLEKSPVNVMTCFANLADNWILKCPDDWVNRVTAVKVTNEDRNSCIRFETTLKGKNISLAEIYKFDADSWQEFSENSNYFMLDKQDNIIFAAKIPDEAWDSKLALTAAQIKEMFSTVTGDWVS